MPKEKKIQMRNQKILETAEKLIMQKGYHHFKMSDISDTLEIAKGTLYNHYISKEDLLFAIIYPKLEKLRDEIKRIATENNSFEEKFRSVIRQSIESDYFHFLLLSYSDVSALFQEKNRLNMEQIQTQIIQAFQEVLNCGRREKVIREDFSMDFLSHQILSTFYPLQHSLLVTDTAIMTHDEFVNQTTNFLLYGIIKR